MVAQQKDGWFEFAELIELAMPEGTNSSWNTKECTLSRVERASKLAKFGKSNEEILLDLVTRCVIKCPRNISFCELSKA